DEPAQPLADDSTPFYLNTQKRPWLPRPDHPRRAAVSAFGFGGSNFHCVLEEAQPDKPQSDWDGSVQIIALDGDSPETILAALSKWKDLDSWDQLTIRAAESRQRFDASAPCRLTIVVTRDGEPVPRMIESALAWLQRESSSNFAASPAGCFWGRGPTPGRLAWLFPGQGSQYVGMLRDWACQFPDMLDALAAADSRGASERWTAAGDRLSDLIFPPPTFSQAKRQQQESALRDTRIAQPALAAVSLGALRVLRSFGVVGEMAAGHSFGELTALYSAGCFGDTEFLDLARMRGRIMAECQREADGGMLAIHATAGDVDRWLGGLQLPLTIANFNSPRQVVVSGPATAIETFQRDLERRGTRATRLPVSAAFHSPQVVDAEPRFREALDTVPIRAPRLPVYSNTTAVPYPHDAAAIRGLLAGQLARPVRFTDLIQRMVRDGAATFVEVGPGNVLTRLVEQIVRESPSGRSVDCLAVDASAGRRSCSADLALALARLPPRGPA
ncbi:MAG: acyltransferase domain-containing protein, partial [Gemmataceae bacterium]|nr:acyltransferase domain-containing protein [Gemmataceae bacterium]